MPENVPPKVVVTSTPSTAVGRAPFADWIEARREEALTEREEDDWYGAWDGADVD